MATTTNGGKMATVKRSDMISVLASKTGLKVEDVDKLEKAIPSTIVDLATEQFESGHTTVLAETSMAGIKFQYHDKGEKKNPDGTTTKVGANIGVSFAPAKKLVTDIQAAANLIGKAAKAAPGLIKAVGAAAKLASAA